MNIRRQPHCVSKKIITLAIASAGLSFIAPQVLAQIGTSSLQGVVELQHQPQSGVQVVAKNIQNGFVFRAVTQQDGHYLFKGLTPGNYQVFIQNSSGSNPDPIHLAVGQALSLDFDLEKNSSADKIDEVLVTGSQLKTNSNGGEVGTQVSLDKISKLPQNTRNFLAFADLAPGVQFTQASDGSTKIKGGAQSANSINVFIDGVGQKNYVLGGGITGQDTSRGNPFPQSAIGEYKVITQNYSAEYDQLSSAAIVAVTASGTNEFHGSMFYDFTNEGMREMRPSEIKSGEKVPSKQGQYGFSVGGPIIQDKMHFFFAYEAKDTADPKDVIPQGGKKADNLPNSLKSYVGGVSAKFQEDLYFGKLDYRISDEQKIELTAKIRKENEVTNVGGVNSLSFGTDKKNDETRLDFSHNWRTENWINDIHLTYEDAVYNPRPHTLANGIRLSNNGKQGVLNIGGGEDFQNKAQKGWGVQEDFTYLAIPNHLLKTGLKYKSVDLTAQEQQPFNPQFEVNMDYDPTFTKPYAVRWGTPLENVGNGSVKAANSQIGLYVQDNWTVSDRLNVDAGIRWDYEQSDAYLDYVTPTDVVAGIEKWEGIKKSNINIKDYISNGHNRESFKNAWQPRLGFTYDLSDENDVAIFGGVGRAYDRNLFDYLQVERTKATFPTYNIQFKTDDPIHPDCNLGSPTSSNCIAFDPKYLTKDGLAQLASNDGSNREVDMINNKLKTPYSDQFSLGVRGSLNEDWKAEISVSHIVSKDGFAWMKANRREDGSFFNGTDTWGSPGSQFGIPGFGDTLIGVNGIETKANSLFIKLNKPKADSIWDMSIAYTYTKAKTNRKDGEHYSTDYPTMHDYGMKTANDLPEHRLVVATMIDLPGGVDFSAKLNLKSVETYYGINCRAGWNACKFDTFKPDSAGFLGYKQLDIAFSKNITTDFLSKGSNLLARLDVLNVTNAVNYENYNDWYGSPDAADANFAKPQDQLASPTMTLKFGVTWNW